MTAQYASNAHCHMKVYIFYKYVTGITKCAILVPSYLRIVDKPYSTLFFTASIYLNFRDMCARATDDYYVDI